MKKRLLSALLCMSMAVCALPTVSFAKEAAEDSSVRQSNRNAASITDFADVDLGSYYANAVEWAVDEEVTNGTSNTTFSPNQVCTRAQVVTFLWRTNGKPEPQSTYNPFYDVSSDAYYYKAVLWAVEQEITKGTSASTFSPDAGCTRGQVVTFLWRAVGSLSSSYTTSPFNDVSIRSYYGEAVLWAVENDITNGTSDTSFSPDMTCTRGQIVTFLYRTEVGQLDRATAAELVYDFLAENGLEEEWFVTDVFRISESYHEMYYMVCTYSYDDEYEYELDYCVYINNYGHGELVGYWDADDELCPIEDLFE